MIKKAVDSIEYWRSQYQNYKELSLIFNAIDKTKKKLKLKS
jgi:hypothetical protein